MEIPTIEDINRQAITRFHERITAGLARPDLSDFSNVVESYHREHDVPIEHIAAVLAALAHGRFAAAALRRAARAYFRRESRS